MIKSDFTPEPYLEKLEALIDVAHVQAAEARQAAAWRFEPVDRRPTIIVKCRPHVYQPWSAGAYQ